VAEDVAEPVLQEAPPAPVVVAPVVAVVAALVEALSPAEDAAADEAPDEVALAADVLAAELAVVVVLEIGPVELLTRVRSGVKLYSSGPTLETLDAGPMMIWTA
jgi:hypothetical protein